MRGSGTYRFVEGPRLQQRSVKRDAATPARRKISVVTQNPMVVFGGGGLGELLRRLLLLAPSRWIARSGRETRQVLQGKEDGGGGVAASHVTCVLLDRNNSFTGSRWTCKEILTWAWRAKALWAFGPGTVSHFATVDLFYIFCIISF
jgi:hypothetical protein